MSGPDWWTCKKHGTHGFVTPDDPGCEGCSKDYKDAMDALLAAARLEGVRAGLAKAADCVRDVQRCTCPTEPGVVRGTDKQHEVWCHCGIIARIRSLDAEAVAKEPTRVATPPDADRNPPLEESP